MLNKDVQQYCETMLALDELTLLELYISRAQAALSVQNLFKELVQLTHPRPVSQICQACGAAQHLPR